MCFVFAFFKQVVILSSWSKRVESVLQKIGEGRLKLFLSFNNNSQQCHEVFSRIEDELCEKIGIKFQKTLLLLLHFAWKL